MPTVTYDYVYFSSGPHQRQPRLPGGPGGFALIGSAPGGDPSGGTFQASPQPSTQVVDGDTYNFTFMNVSGGYSSAAGGAPIGVTSTESTIPPPAVYVRNLPIVVLVVYLPSGGGVAGRRVSGATIDAFDETTGILVDNTFVTVSPDGSQNNEANQYGWVATTNTETVAALSPITPSSTDRNTVNANFDKWVNLQDPQSDIVTSSNNGETVTEVEISGVNLKVTQGWSVSALAFYKSPPSPPPLDHCHSLANEVQTLLDTVGAANIPPLVKAILRREITGCERELGATEADHLLTSLFPEQPPPRSPPR